MNEISKKEHLVSCQEDSMYMYTHVLFYRIVKTISDKYYFL